MQTVLDAYPRPPCAELLGWHVLDARPADGWIKVGFEGRREFLNPAGFIQGGFLAAMLDDTQGPALFAMTEGRIYAPTIDFTVSFVKAARPGRFVCRGRVVNLGKTIAFTEAELFDESGELVARGTFSSRVMDTGRAVGND